MASGAGTSGVIYIVVLRCFPLAILFVCRLVVILLIIRLFLAVLI